MYESVCCDATAAEVIAFIQFIYFRKCPGGMHGLGPICHTTMRSCINMR